MKESTEKIIQERFKKLPSTLQKAITSNDFKDGLRTISEKYKLHLDKGVTLENETLMVMMGLDDTSSFTQNLQRGLGIDKEQAEKITADVAKDILLPIRESLKELLSTQDIEEEVVPEESVIKTEEIAPEEEPENAKTDLSTQKLNETTQRSTQEVSVEDKEEKKKPFSDDPYRETIE